MYKQRGFTLIELLVVISIIALLIGILLPALGAARTTARRMESNTRIRGIAQAYNMWAAENDGTLPGMTPNGEFIDGSQAGYPNWINQGWSSGSFAGTRMGLMVYLEYAPPVYLISPLEENEGMAPIDPETATTITGRDNYSYATLAIMDNRALRSQDRVPMAAPRGWPSRQAEWVNGTLNSQLPVVSDRALDTGSAPGTADSANISSLHTELNSGDWRGGIAFGDGHVIFSDTHVIRTRLDGFRNNADSLFTPNSFVSTSDLNNAAMTWSGNSTYYDPWTMRD